MSAPADSGWVAFAERKPTPMDFPIWVWSQLSPRVGPDLCKADNPFGGSHWMRATLPEPPEPPKALSLEERDLADFKEAFGERGGSVEWHASWSGWKRAKQHERQEVRALLESAKPYGFTGGMGIPCETWRKLAERVGLKP